MPRRRHREGCRRRIKRECASGYPTSSDEAGGDPQRGVGSFRKVEMPGFAEPPAAPTVVVK